MPDLAPGSGSITLTGGTPTVSLAINLAPGPGQIQLIGSTPGVSLVRTVGTGNQLYIDDVLVDCGWHESTLRISKTLSAAWSASFDIDHFSGALPEAGQEVAIFWQSVKRFGGLILSVKESGALGGAANNPIPHSVLHIECTGYQSYCDRVIVADLFTIFMGGLDGITVYNLWYKYLRQFGVTKPNAFGLGVFLGEQLFHYITMTECLNRIKAQVPGWEWWIDDNKILHWEVPGTAAAFSLANGDANADTMEVTVSNGRFRNKQWVLPSRDMIALRTDTETGDGVSAQFPTQYSQQGKPIVLVASVEQIVTAFGNWIAGWQVYYIPGGIGVFFASAPAAAAVIEIKYPNPFPLAFSAQDDTSIAAVGLFESIYQAKNIIDEDSSIAMAQGLLDRYGTNGIFPAEIVVQYNSSRQSAWLAPGMVITVSRTFPTASGDFTVESVESAEEKRTLWRHNVTLRLGLGEVGDESQLEALLVATRVPISSPPVRATLSLGVDIPGITNPGMSVGVVAGSWTAQVVGVISSWDAQASTDPPTGADMVINIFQNGVSIFLPTNAKRIVIPDGDTSRVSGFQFVTDNIPVAVGDEFTAEVLQVGSTNPGKNILLHINIKSGQA